LVGRRVRLIGIGTSWHAAHHGAWFLRDAGIEAEALHAADVAPYGRVIDPADGVIVLSHTGGTGYSMTMLERAREAGAETLHISGIGNGGDIETVPAEQSYAYTASHTAALLVLAQIAARLGAQLGPLDAIPERVAAVLDLPGALIAVPDRLVELIGAGPNGWTAQEGALKIREASYVAAEGLSAEQFFHGPSVAVDEQDTLVVLDGGGPMADRTEAIAAAVEVTGAKVARFPQRELGEALSVFPLTVVVQRIALELSEARGPGPLPLRGGRAPRGGVRGARLLTSSIMIAVARAPRPPNRLTVRRRVGAPRRGRCHTRGRSCRRALGSARCAGAAR
jgi:glucosamine--fructose-6-phosphate aminotransferase (isomerizing)